MTTKITITTNPKYPLKSVARRLAFVAALIVPGVIMGSAAMQWLGFLCIILAAVGQIAEAAKKSEGITIAEARNLLDELEAKEARA